MFTDYYVKITLAYIHIQQSYIIKMSNNNNTNTRPDIILTPIAKQRNLHHNP